MRFLAFVVLSLVMSFDPAFAGLISCPTGYNIRGLNCCRIRDGQPECFRNTAAFREVDVAAAMQGLLIMNDNDEPPVDDEGDLRSAPPIGKGKRYHYTTSVGQDICRSSKCEFDYIRAIAKAAPQNVCTARLYKHYCENSMWKNLSIEKRFLRILELGQKYAEDSDIDVRALPCVAARETLFLEPLTVSTVNCGGYSSDEGLGQILRPTFTYYYRQQGFRSELVPHEKSLRSPSNESLDRIFSELGMNAEKQIELMAWTLADKKGKGSYRQAFVDYNGSPHKETYGRLVNACYECMVKRVDAKTLEIRGNPMRCLSAALGKGRDIKHDFKSFRSLCK